MTEFEPKQSGELSTGQTRVDVWGWWAPVFALLAFVISLAVSWQVFIHQPVTGDEGSYLFQTNSFLDGKIVRECPPNYYNFLSYDMIILDPEKGWLSRYPFAHSVWLMPGVAVGNPWLMSAFSAALTMLFAYGIGLRLRMPYWLMPVLLLLSPFFLLVQGTVLSHTSGMAAATGMLYFYIRWRQDDRLPSALFAGLCWAFLVNNRTWTAQLMAVPYAIDALVVLGRKWKDSRAWIGTILFAGAALGGIAAYLLYNELSTGSFKQPTYLFYSASDGLGFGIRNEPGGSLYRVNHTLFRGLGITWNNLRLFDLWMFGLPFVSFAWIVLAGHGWSRRWSGILLGCFALVPFGYIFFWFEGIDEVGPVYYAEVLVYALLAGALGLSRIWRRAAKKAGVRHVLVVGMLVAMAVPSGLFLKDRVVSLRKGENPEDPAFVGLEFQSNLDEKLNALPGEAIVFMDDMNKFGEAGRRTYLNPRGMDTRVLRFQSRGDTDSITAASLPGRKAYKLSTAEGITLSPLPAMKSSYERLGRTFHPYPGRNAANDGSARVAIEGEYEEGWLAYGWYLLLPEGTHRFVFDIDVQDVPVSSPVRIEVVGERGENIIASREITNALSEREIEVTIDTPREIELRVFYGGKGTATFKKATWQTQAPDASDTPDNLEELPAL